MKNQIDTNLLPSIVQELTGKFIHEYLNVLEEEITYSQMANCWNATMLFHRALDNVRYVEESEAKNWLVKSTESIIRPRKRGDILSVWYGNQLEHTAVYVGKGTYWHKLGCDTRWPWEFVSFCEIMKHYSCADVRYYRVR